MVDIARRRARLLAMLLTAVLAASACGTTRPTQDPIHVLHIEDRVGQAIIVGVNGETSSSPYTTAARPCGGHVDLTVGLEIPRSGRWSVGVVIDPSGSFDAALAAWSGDPHDMPGSFGGSIVWTAADIEQSSLPRWVSITPNGAVVSDRAPAVPAPPHCGSISEPSPTPP